MIRWNENIILDLSKTDVDMMKPISEYQDDNRIFKDMVLKREERILCYHVDD